ncbi:MAG: anaerobic ribonucleoside-triphosphate reductase activating protein [Oscillospiraceae bacterium]|nr:anaerobic ribonucleoside-triphosphate reductase activating protein [Oscillospiraceae bacterium]
MRISGLQKMTLLDFPGVVACTVFTGGCNFRCPFCHNASLVLPEAIQPTDIPAEEILSFLRKRRGLLDGVAITGGEPLLHADMADLLSEIKALGYRVKLDTNGTFPDRLISLVERGLVDRVAMDVKNDPALYAKTAGLETMDMSGVTKSKDFLLSGAVEYEFRTTVVRGLHTRESLIEAAKWIKGAEAYFLQQFKDSGELIDPNGLGSFSGDEMRELLDAVKPIIPTVQLRGVE